MKCSTSAHRARIPLLAAAAALCVAALLIAPCPDDSEAATFTVRSGESITVPTGFSEDDISSIVEGSADWTIMGTLVGKFYSTMSPDYSSITLRIKNDAPAGSYSCKIYLVIISTSDEDLKAEHVVNVVASPSPPPVCTVSFNGNGGTVSATTMQVVAGNEITLPADGTRAGHILDGWTEDSAAGAFHAAGSKVPIFQNVTFFAHWKEVSAAGLDPLAPKVCNLNKEYTYSPILGPNTKNVWQMLVLTTMESAVGYPPILTSLPEWMHMDNAQTNASKPPKLTFRGTPAVPGVYEVHVWVKGYRDSTEVHWTVTVSIPNPEHTVTYSPGAGNGSYPSQVGVDGSIITLPSAFHVAMLRPGYTLAGWSCDDGYGSTATYALGSIYTIQGHDVLFTAVWAPDHGVVVFDAAGGSWSGGENARYYVAQTDGTVTLLSEGPVYSTGLFKGWYRASDSSKVYAPGYIMPVNNVSETIIMNAYYFSGNAFAVSFNPNGGLGQTLTQSVAPGKSVVLPSAGFVHPDGKSLLGWDTSSAAAAPSYLPGSAVPITSPSVTFYAIWSASSTPVQKHTVTFDLDGGTGTAPAQQVAQGGLVTRPPDPTKERMTFNYWQDITMAAVWDFSQPPTHDLVLRAVWIEVFKITVEGNVLHLDIAAQFAVKGVTTDWGDGSTPTVGTHGAPSHEYEDYHFGRVTVSWEDGGVTRSSSASFKVGAATADAGGGTDRSAVCAVALVALLLIMAALAYLRMYSLAALAGMAAAGATACLLWWCR
ncbi:InlB B-repeat-containing protein [Methanomassiliicoccaceae archaeon COG_1]|nr:InlB B-repeat-containing protein [Methanomassiliicoccaceae archaeon COG_1]